MPPRSEFQNRLSREKSPYLLQHADNPVDWYPWGKEAFEKAKAEDKPIFLSVGYSTCHWCHVMEHESFENQEAAQIINNYFVPIKVDREERPDIDHIYMTAVMAMTGQGGWPLTVFLTPEGKPFFGGTYFPLYAQGGSPGLMDILRSVYDAWQNERSRIAQSGDSIADVLRQEASRQPQGGELKDDVLKAGFGALNMSYDSHFGGFGTAPKFPSGHHLSFLLRYGQRYGSTEALAMVEHTLEQMAAGGLYDHLGGGFHRYATDRRWRIPHFEKMLYDQAALSRAYLEAYQVTKKELYARIAREILDYVLRDMQSPDGGFYSAEDADSLDPAQSSQKKEGAFYLWQEAEIVRILDAREAEIFNYYFGVKPDGNAETDPYGEFQGKNILYTEKDLQETAAYFQESLSDVEAVLRRSREKLFRYRQGRPRPFLDDKILVDWNGLMISSLAFGSRVLHEPRYQEAAQGAADFILKRLVDEKGRLRHRYRQGEAGGVGTIEDYAFFIQGLLDVYEATFSAVYLKQARRLTEEMIHLFWDETDGGFYFTADDAEKLLFRPKIVYDGAVASGNGVAALDLARLYHITLDKGLEEKFKSFFQAFAAAIERNPGSYAQVLIAFDFAQGPSQEIVIAALRSDERVQAMRDAVSARFLPRAVIMLHETGAKEKNQIVAMAPFIKDQIPREGQVTAYVCENHACKLPLTDIKKFEELLDKLR